VDSKGEIVQTPTEENVQVDKDNADRAVFVKMEGWDVPLELRVHPRQRRATLASGHSRLFDSSSSATLCGGCEVARTAGIHFG